MNGFEKSRLELELSSVRSRIESCKCDIKEVLILKRDVLWTVNNKWLNLKRRLCDLMGIERELEVAIGVDKAVVKEVSLELVGDKEVVCKEVSLVEAVDIWISDLRSSMRVKSFVEDRRRVSKGEDVFCNKCLKQIKDGRWFYKSGYCALCERNKVLRLEPLSLARDRKLSKEFRDIVSVK